MKVWVQLLSGLVRDVLKTCYFIGINWILRNVGTDRFRVGMLVRLLQEFHAHRFLAWSLGCAAYSGLACQFVQFTRGWVTESVCPVYLGSGQSGYWIYSGQFFINTGHWFMEGRPILLTDLGASGTRSQTHCAHIGTAHWNACAV